MTRLLVVINRVHLSTSSGIPFFLWVAWWRDEEEDGWVGDGWRKGGRLERCFPCPPNPPPPPPIIDQHLPPTLPTNPPLLGQPPSPPPSPPPLLDQHLPSSSPLLPPPSQARHTPGRATPCHHHPGGGVPPLAPAAVSVDDQKLNFATFSLKHRGTSPGHEYMYVTEATPAPCPAPCPLPWDCACGYFRLVLYSPAPALPCPCPALPWDCACGYHRLVP
ncbi:hypothetical protein Pmani_035986 [Petrolisthes manimaculis]|uniref:Uncharacterized protein n=1 Tax=Petrolisthes manimaculis TaxID=1843537 RepID=A0AAE1NJG2_9EUCA|nr:hypothetical protein Pmani_035986 [Petrolisthes manimaculis]